MTSERDDTREGKGRVRPGPSPSPHSRARKRSSVPLTLLGALVVLAAGAASSVFGTQAHQYSSPAALALVAAFGALAGVAVAAGLSATRSAGVAEWLPATLAGAGGFAIAPWLVMANRYTDAPPGSEVMFFTTACWGALLAVAVVALSSRRVSRLGGLLLALAGAAGVVANWERPSSFSPFVRYATEEAWMLAAGLLWVVLVLVLETSARRGRLAPAALYAALGGVAGASVLAGIALAGGGVAAPDFGQPGVLAFGLATAFATAGMLMVLRSGSALGIAHAYLLMPASISLLLLLEQVLGMRGPNPMLVGPVLAAAVSTVAGLVLLQGRRRRPHVEITGGRALLSRAVAALAVAAALVALALPAMVATVSALRTDGTEFRASFPIYGFETAGVWLALGVALAALGLALERERLQTGWTRGLALAAAAAAWPFIAATPLRTLTSFIPSEVQVDYGSEFARIDFGGFPPLLAAVAIGGALVAVAVLLSRRLSQPGGRLAAADDDREVVAS